MSSIAGFRDQQLSTRRMSGSSQYEPPPATKAAPKAATAAVSQGAAEPDVHYTCFVRLPFPRGDFVDPPQVDWSSVKDRALWRLISKASSSKDLDWEDLSARFDVSLSFLLQQAAWLYERHFAQMKAQMKKLSPSANPSPIPPDSTSNLGTPVAGDFPTNIIGPRTTSALSGRNRDSPTPNAGSGMYQTILGSSVLATEAPIAAATATLTSPRRVPGQYPAPKNRLNSLTSPTPSNRSFRSAFNTQRRTTPPTTTGAPVVGLDGYDSPPPADVSSASESSSENDERLSQSMLRSQAFRRPPLGNKGVVRGGPGMLSHAEEADEDEDDDDDDESSGGFLPFATAATAPSKGEDDLTGTLRSTVPKTATAKRHAAERKERLKAAELESSGSSGSSNIGGGPSRAPGLHPVAASKTRNTAVSPRIAELGLGGSGSRGGVIRDGSEGAPSMGSSFSDLDDASISQSALEDAYLSNLQRGGGAASRMSTISQALRSKYL